MERYFFDKFLSIVSDVNFSIVLNKSDVDYVDVEVLDGADISVEKNNNEIKIFDLLKKKSLEGCFSEKFDSKLDEPLTLRNFFSFLKTHVHEFSRSNEVESDAYVKITVGVNSDFSLKIKANNVDFFSDSVIIGDLTIKANNVSMLSKSSSISGNILCNKLKCDLHNIVVPSVFNIKSNIAFVNLSRDQSRPVEVKAKGNSIKINDFARCKYFEGVVSIFSNKANITIDA